MEENKEKKMRSVELTIWTGDLGMIDITPVSKKYANKYIGSGKEPDDVYEQFEDTCSIYFVNGNEHVNLKVKDGDKELSYDNLPQLDFGVADDYRDYTLQEFLEDIWDGDDDNKPQSEEDIIKYLDDNFDDDDDSWPAWKVLHNANLDEAPGVFCKLWEEFEEGGYIDFVNYIRLQAQEYNEAFSDDGINFYACGSVGKGQVNFYIELPEDEEFDIKKLHFPCSCDWWDDDFGLSDECFNVFRGMDVLLEVVEYDGRFYRMTNPYFVPGWKDFGGAKFLDCELEELEYDEELDDED